MVRLEENPGEDDIRGTIVEHEGHMIGGDAKSIDQRLHEPCSRNIRVVRDHPNSYHEKIIVEVSRDNPILQ